MKDHLILFVIAALSLISCKSNDHVPEDIPSKQNKVSVKKPSHMSIEDNLPLDTAMAPITSGSKRQDEFVSVFPLGTFESYPQIVKNIFGEGSKINEVRSVMGRPELIEQIKLGYETWYYGNIEIHFKYGIVNEVVNSDKCSRYASQFLLSMSKDPIERKFGNMLFKRLVSISGSIN